MPDPINTTFVTEYLNSEETTLTKIGIRTDGILEIRFKIDEYQVEINDQLEIHNAIVKLTNNGSTSHHILVLPGKYGGVSKEAREMEMFGKEGFENQNSITVVVQNFSQRLLGKLYFTLKKNKPKYPYNFFDSEEVAVQWILNQ